MQKTERANEDPRDGEGEVRWRWSQILKSIVEGRVIVIKDFGEDEVGAGD